MKITLRLSTQKQETTDMGFNLDDYEPVASRIQRFYEAYPNGAIHCEIVHDDGKRVMVKATVWRDINDPQASAVDYAEEHLSDRGVNATSRTENACTSATGRAISIAAHGLGPSDWTKKPSREEMSKVQNAKPARTPLTNVKRVASISQNGVRTFEDGTIQAPPDLLGVAIKGKQHGPLPEWFLQDAFAAGVAECWDNRDKVAGTKRPWFKDAHGEKAFWPPKGTPDPQLEVETYDDSPEEPF
jgi:hypothetical protein